MEPLMIVPFVYVLELENKKWYVGITNNINIRLAQHWTTKLHKPVRIERVVYDCRTSDEKKYHP